GSSVRSTPGAATRRVRSVAGVFARSADGDRWRGYGRPAAMRKLLIVGALALTLVVLAPPVAGQAAPNHDQASGTGALGLFGDPRAHVNAVATPSGVKGSVTIDYPDGTALAGTVTCLFVSGNTAYVTGRITEASGPRQAPNGWFP